MSEAQGTIESTWFYEDKGGRKGPVAEVDIIKLIKSSVISQGTLVWKQGFPDWLKVENTDLKTHLDNSLPPPLSGASIKSTIVWVLAFAPYIGKFLEGMIAMVVHGNEYDAMDAVANGHFFFISVLLNIGLSYYDEKRLKAAGHDTSKFKGWCWLVPVYLYQRAKATQQNLAYFIVWIVCFALSLMS